MSKARFRRDDSYDEPVNVEMDPEDAVRLMLSEPSDASVEVQDDPTAS